MTCTDRAHGLAGGYVKADWPLLRDDEITRVAALYPDVGSPARSTWRSERPLSAAAIIASPHGRFFLKRHHRSVRSTATLDEEHRFIAHLRAHGMATPRILAAATGATATAAGEWVYEVQTCAAGTDLYRDAMSWVPITEVAHAHAAGRTLAALHDAAAGYAAPQRATHLLVARSDILRAADPADVLAAQLPNRPGLGDYLRRRNWRRDLAGACGPGQRDFAARIASQPAMWTHGDWHVSNLCWTGTGADARVSAVFDFGLAAANFALFDLATAIERNAIAWLALDANAARVPIARALIAGYRELRPLAPDAVALLADVLPRVHIDYALSEVEYYHAVTRADVNADVAYDTFLIGHAAWFRTAGGRGLLDAIRACA
ncbi:MAG TPA: phosphotransferase [Rhodanobacteraceae bacterium]